MAIQDINTTVPDVNNRGGGVAAYFEDNVSFESNTSEDTKYIAAPCDGKLVQATVQGTVTSDATATYTVTVTNKSNSDAAMLGTTVYDDDPVLTAFTAANPTLSTTEADLVVEKGDMIEVSMTGGTGSGEVAVLLTFEGS